MTVNLISKQMEKKFHQGNAISSWIDKHYNNKNSFAQFVAEESDAENTTQKYNSVYSLARNISGKEFIGRKYHERWDTEVAPYTDQRLKLAEILEKMGEKEMERVRGFIVDDYQKQLWIAEGKIQAHREDYTKLLKNYNDLTQTLAKKANL